MRPESRKTKETSKSAVAARAKMMQAANLGWLDGFPLEPRDGGVRWATMPPQAPAEEMTLDGRHLSRATYTLNKLRTELAPALPRLADEPDRWLESIERRLELLKQTLHHGAPLPARAFEILLEPRLRDRAARIADAEPRLQPLLDAVAWTHAGEPARAKAMLDAAGGWADGLDLITERLGREPALVLVTRLLQLAADHGRELTAPLVSYLFDRRPHEVPTHHEGVCSQILGALSKRPKAPLPEGLPMAYRTNHLLLWVEDLIRVDRRTQRLCLRLFAVATPLPLVERWERWWEATRRLIREARGQLVRPYESEARQALRKRVQAHQKEAPPTLNPEELLTRLRQAAKPEASAWTEPLARALALVPERALDSTKLFLHWSSQASGSPARVPAMLAGFERYLKRRPVADPKVLLRPWAPIESISYPMLVEDEIDIHLGEQPRHRTMAVYDHLATVAELRGGLTADEAKRVVELFAEAGQTGLDRDPGLTAAFLDSLVKAERLNNYLRGHAVRLAVHLCRSRPESFADVLKVLSDPEDDSDFSLDQWPEAVLGPLCSGGLEEVVRESVVTRQLSRLLACGLKAIVLNAADTVRPLPLPIVGELEEDDPEWIQRLPPELHPQLRRLASVLDDAEARVGRWLADDLPDTVRLQREIEAIQARIDQVEEDRRPALRKRLASLRSRLEQPAAPSTARIERLRTKLDRAWGRTVLDRWERDLDAHLPAALRKVIGLEGEIPDWMTEPRNLELVATATRLEPRHRSLAWRLFRERCGPPPWDLRDAPQNLAFRQRLAHLDWSPWIDGAGTTAVQAGETRLHLRLEDDPLEVFRMGGHFRTCLSPGSFNYFSVFTNVADVNKRVIYARDDSGRFVGRCLMALTAEGRLLMFQAYCHDGSLGFESICSNFVDDLARRMGTVRVREGKVPTLVASDWYDDGPLDLGHRFACLEENSELRRKLATVRPGDLIAELRKSLKPAGLNEVTLPLVLDLPELRERPELAVPLLKPMAEHRALPDRSVITATVLGLEAGAGDLVRRLLAPRLTDHINQWIKSPWRLDPRAVDVLVQLDPARLLEVLRRIRAKSARNWSEMTDGLLLEAAARALQALHRPRQARALWQRLATDNDVSAGCEMRERARAALERTERTART
ncbi:MAG TPA: hypothetical protein VH394_26660 [Thermoanaerobaculia bacterium]|jgi:hypothetical protein|nr:hypothetical protein [Thermoanaerobaculia bacterium]